MQRTTRPRLSALPAKLAGRIRRIALLVLSLAPAALAADPPDIGLLPRAHAHNDYEHPRPLLDALEQGFGSVEADIHLVDGQLLVAHDRRQTRPDRTLESLYLAPLRERILAHGGRVHPDAPEFFLLIDFKSDAETTWPVLRELLRRYEGICTRFGPGDRIQTNALTIILSGNSPRALLAKERVRLAAIDGRPPDLEANPPVSLVPWISESWGRLFRWRANGPFPPDEAERLRRFVEQAHAQGRRVRFWGVPDHPIAWQVLWDAGVDWINTDRLADLHRFIRERQHGQANAAPSPRAH
ncbi:MAG: hypothetical protein D6766_01390 [Verrucomicrobia bacterium]|nr:MAG: hypothetical protein D6766_01390 [Verrucomicrobiota bacterium]